MIRFLSIYCRILHALSSYHVSLLETADILSSAWAEFFRFPPGGDEKPADCLIFDAFIVASPAKCFVLMEWFYSEYFLNYVAVTVRAGRAVH